MKKIISTQRNACIDYKIKNRPKLQLQIARLYNCAQNKLNQSKEECKETLRQINFVDQLFMEPKKKIVTLEKTIITATATQC